MTEYCPAKTGEYQRIFSNFENCARCEKDLKDNKDNSLHLGRNRLGYLSLDIITVFIELRSRKTVRFSEKIMSADKYPCIFSRQMAAIVYVYRSDLTPFKCWSGFRFFLGLIASFLHARLILTSGRQW